MRISANFITFYDEHHVYHTHRIDDLEYIEHNPDSLCLNVFFRIKEAVVKYSLHGEDAIKLWMALKEEDMGEHFLAQQTVLTHRDLR